jgi:hypothetical protein
LHSIGSRVDCPLCLPVADTKPQAAGRECVLSRRLYAAPSSKANHRAGSVQSLPGVWEEMSRHPNRRRMRTL